MTAHPIAHGVAGVVGRFGGALLVGAMLGGCAGGVAAPAPQPAPTARATATVAPAVTPLAGAVLLAEGFEPPAASGFDSGEDERGRYAFERGGYVLAVKARQTLVWALADGAYGDATISVEAALPAGERGTAAGLIFRYQNDANFYLFQISGTGYYTLELLANNELSTLIDWTQSDAITATTNELRVETRGDRIALYVNGSRLEETRDPSFSGGGVGLAANSFDEPDPAVLFDNLLVVQR